MNNENLDFMCEKVRIAICAGDELDNEMKAHLEECHECRTFRQQSLILEASLKELSVETLTRNGKSVADSVMEEISKQSVFTNGSPVKSKNGIFRHMGLIAACAVLVVMALPMINSLSGSKDADNEYISSDSGVSEYSDESHAEPATSGGGSGGGASTTESDANELARFGVYTEAEQAPAETVAETVSEEASDEEPEEAQEAPMMLMAAPLEHEGDAKPSENGDETDSAAAYDDAILQDGNESKQEYSYNNGTNSSYEYSDAITDTDISQDVTLAEDAHEELKGASLHPLCADEIADAAFMGAVDLCRNTELMGDVLPQISYGDEGVSAYAVYLLENGEKITVYLEFYDGLWWVANACYGDITE